jgi:hypothetical protein
MNVMISVSYYLDNFINHLSLFDNNIFFIESCPRDDQQHEETDCDEKVTASTMG